MLESITKNYEEAIFTNIAKQYDKMIANDLSQEIIEQFCICQEHSILSQNSRTAFDAFQTQFANTYSGLPEFIAENPYLTLQIRHIFHPNLQPKFDSAMQNINEFHVSGFHHDVNLQLHKSGMYSFINKVYGADQCYKAKLDFGNNITPNKEKTFFPASWSQEKVIQTIFEASQNKIKDISEQKSPLKIFLCQVDSLFIDIVINNKNMITSAYPSKKNFRI